MANSARPIGIGIKKEAPMTIHSHTLAYGKPNGLINGFSENEWNTDNIAYWGNSLDYIEVSFDREVNIWRSGTKGWYKYNHPLRIKKFNGSTYDEDVSELYNLPTTEIHHDQWEMFVHNLPAGKYRFEYTNLRIDSEWYIEDVNGEDAENIKSNIDLIENIGDIIPCNYEADADIVGVFHGLGDDNLEPIPSKSTSTPNGKFYWRFIGYDHLGRKMFITDRNIQHSISYNALNDKGIITGLDINIPKMLIPKMTSSTTPMGKVFASSIANINNQPYKAFDGKLDSTGNNYWLGVAPPQQIGYEFDESTIINYYTIKAAINQIYSTLEDFTFEGFDGKEWVVLDKQTGLEWKDGEYKEFKINNTIPYIKYRLNITKVKSSPNVSIDMFNMGYIEESDKYKYTLRLLTGGISADDKDNEWDKIICESDLDGTITPGSNTAWNYNAGGVLQSWTSTTYGTNSATRVARAGTDDVTLYNAQSPNTKSNQMGFRPVLLVESINHITDVKFTNTNICKNDTDYITVSGKILNEEVNQIKYSINVNGIEIYKSGSLSTPITINTDINKDLFVVGDNLVEILIIDEHGSKNIFEYIITKEDRDTFNYAKRLEHDISPIVEGDVKLLVNRGSGVEGYGIGSGIIKVPTEGKASIKNILINQSSNVDKNIKIVEDMTPNGIMYENEIDLSKVSKLIKVDIEFK